MKLEQIKAKYIARLVSTGNYDLDDLKVLKLPQLRALVDKEFPIIFESMSVTANGGIKRVKTIYKRRG